MARTLADLEKIMDSGQVEEALERFIAETLDANFEAARNKEDTSSALLISRFDDQVIAAACLIRLLNTSHGRAALHLAARKKGKSYDADKLFYSNQAILELATKLHLGRLDKVDALNELSIALESEYGEPPSNNTLNRLLCDLEEVAARAVADIVGLSEDQVNARIEEDMRIIGGDADTSGTNKINRR